MNTNEYSLVFISINGYRRIDIDALYPLVLMNTNEYSLILITTLNGVRQIVCPGQGVLGGKCYSGNAPAGRESARKRADFA